MRVISFMNMKGGVGKTTLAVNLAYGLAYFHGKKVLLVDVDPQFNATQSLLGEDAYMAHLDDPKKHTIEDILVPKRAGRVRTLVGLSRPTKLGIELSTCICQIASETPTKGKLDLLPSNLALVDVETAPRQSEGRLKRFIRQKATHYDFILIDCPPTISIFTQAAILASDMYVVPVKPDPLSVVGLPLLERWLEDYIEATGSSIVQAGLIFTMVRRPLPQAMKTVMATVRSARPKEVFSAELDQSTNVAASQNVQQPVFLFKKGSKAAQQVQKITAEFLRRIEA